MSGETHSTHTALHTDLKTFQEEWRVNGIQCDGIWRWFLHEALLLNYTAISIFCFVRIPHTHFRPRGFLPLSSLRCSFHQIPHRLPIERRIILQVNPHEWRHFNFRPHSSKFVCNRRSTRGSFSLVPIIARLFPDSYLHYITYISMIVSTALAHSRHQKNNEING